MKMNDTYTEAINFYNSMGNKLDEMEIKKRNPTEDNEKGSVK